jgi:hypothetical protein
VLHDAVTDHDCLVTGIDSDVNVQSESDHSSCQFLQQLHQVLIPLILGDLLVFPKSEGVSCSPPQPHSLGVGRLLDKTKLAGQVAARIGDAIADAADDLDAALHQLVFDIGAELGRQTLQQIATTANQLLCLGINDSEFEFDTDRVVRIGVEL